MKYEVVVELKPEVLDPEGRAIQETLDRLGYESLKEVEVSKRYVLDIADGDGDPKKVVDGIAAEYLANVVAENFTVRPLPAEDQ